MSQEDLTTFNWDTEVPEMDFFGEEAPVGIEPKGEEDKPKEKEEKQESSKDESTPKGKEKEETTEEEQIDFFGEEAPTNTEDSDDEDSNTDKSKDAQQDVISNKSVVNFLKDKGFIDFELEEGEELDDDLAEQLLEDSYEEALEERLEKSISELPDVVKNLVRFVNKGGDANEFISNLNSNTSELSKDMDLTKESNQEKVIRFKLSQEGNDEEYIDAHLEFLKDSGKLENVSKSVFNKWKEQQDKIDEKLVKEQEQRRQQAKQNEITFKREVSQHLSENKTINGFKFNRSDVRDLPDYISSASVELEDGRRISPFYRDFFDAMKDKNKLAVLAKILKSNFDFKDIEKSASTKEASKLKEDIRRQSEKQKINSTAGSSQPKRLSDYL